MEEEYVIPFHPKSKKYKAFTMLDGLGIDEIVPKCPKDMESNDWIVSNLVYLWIRTLDMRDALKEGCTSSTCKTMMVSGRYRYMWSRSPKEEARDLDAPAYTGKALEWVEANFQDHEIFHDQEKMPYVEEFGEIASLILSTLLTVLGHYWTFHKDSLKRSSLDGEMGSLLRYVRRFSSYWSLGEAGMFDPLPGPY
ncbi:MAG: MOB kinase activator-like protein [Amphiamblys sp. WSBS2006]|nr:MAG: MOB kinase activator-like protein [Amphiamblys sp. WSBS2006]